jgi:6-pyruvoyl-tetrahydropterin synthase
MKRQLNLSNKEQDEFINRADFELINDIYDEMMIPEKLNFTEFFRRYQKKHLRKYGKTLSVLDKKQIIIL